MTPQYVPVSKKEFNTVEIDIRDDTGRPVPFEFGKVITTLHFRSKILHSFIFLNIVPSTLKQYFR